MSGTEELIGQTLEAMVYGQVSTENPRLARSGTELTRRENALLMAHLNSRDAAGELRLLTSQSNVYPGGRPLLSDVHSKLTYYPLSHRHSLP